MLNSPEKLAWDLLVELRKELVEKSANPHTDNQPEDHFCGQCSSIVAANLDKVPPYVLVVASFSALFFDLLINSYSFSIKRIGYYIRNHIEPILRVTNNWPSSHFLWEEFMIRPNVKQKLSYWGNSGMTLLVVIIGVASLYMPANIPLADELRIALASSLIAFLLLVYWRIRAQFLFDRPLTK